MPCLKTIVKEFEFLSFRLDELSKLIAKTYSVTDSLDYLDESKIELLNSIDCLKKEVDLEINL